MKALLCRELGHYKNMEVGDAPDPVVKPGHVVIDVKAAGLNFPDILLVRGEYQANPPLPFTPGAECAGVISAVGDGVTNVKLGDRVFASMLLGAFAEKVMVPAVTVFPMSDAMTFEDAAGFTLTYGTSYHALKQRAKLQKDETMLVLGAAGGVGLTAVELGTLMGAKVIAAASTDEKLAVTKEYGAVDGINYSNDALKARVKEITGGKGVDVVYDPVGAGMAEQALRLVNPEGRFLVIGFAAGEIPKIPLNLPLLKGCQIVGVFWGAWVQRDPKAHVANMRELLGFYAEGKIKPRNSATYPVADFVQAFDDIAERRARGKVILTF